MTDGGKGKPVLPDHPPAAFRPRGQANPQIVALASALACSARLACQNDGFNLAEAFRSCNGQIKRSGAQLGVMGVEEGDRPASAKRLNRDAQDAPLPVSRFARQGRALGAALKWPVHGCEPSC